MELILENSSMSLPVCEEMHVLAVDDSHVDRKFIERLLKVSSFKVTVVESGTRALQYLGLDGEKSSVELSGLKVNLIMTDYSMPGMSGYELLKKIKESSAFREVPVVVMSSEEILPRINSCLEEGAEEFLLKPVKLSDVERLRRSIMRYVGVNGGKSTSKWKYPRVRCPISVASKAPLPSVASCLSLPHLDLQSSCPSSTSSSAKRFRL